MSIKTTVPPLNTYVIIDVKDYHDYLNLVSQNIRLNGQHCVLMLILRLHKQDILSVVI